MNKKDAEHIAVFYEGQDDLIDILAVSMASVCYNTKSFVDFYILDCGICDFNKKQLELLKEKFANFSIEYIPIDLKQFEGLKGYTEKNFIDCYSRLLIPELKPKLNKVIYLDTDVIAVSDIKKLYDEEIAPYAIAGVNDIFYGNYEFIKQAKIPANHIYMNAGILVIDCNKWRRKNITQKCLDEAKKYKNYLGAIIEDILNSVFRKNNYKLLPFRYGYSQLPNTSAFLGKYSAVDNTFLKEEQKHTLLVHFSGKNKPWERTTSWNYNIPNIEYIKSKIYFFDQFWFFVEMTPFHEGLNKRFINNITISSHIEHIYYQLNTINYKIDQLILRLNKERIKRIKFLNFLPILKIKRKNNVSQYKLFGFIPLFKIKER